MIPRKERRTTQMTRDVFEVYGMTDKAEWKLVNAL